MIPTDPATYTDFETQGNILIVRYKTNLPMTKEIAEAIVDHRLKLANGRNFKMVIVLPQLRVVEKEARDFLSTERGIEGISASAMVTQSPISRAIINFFLKINFNRPNNIPNKIFNTEEKALNWLRGV